MGLGGGGGGGDSTKKKNIRAYELNAAREATFIECVQLFGSLVCLQSKRNVWGTA